MLLTTDAKTQSDYPITGAVVLRAESQKIFHDLIMPPAGATVNSVEIYISVYGGCVWQYLVGTMPTHSSKFALKDLGHLTMPVMDVLTNKTIRMFLQDFARREDEATRSH